MTNEICTLEINNISNRDLANYPMSCGVPFACRAVSGKDGLFLTDGDTGFPAQVTPTQYWPDGSLRWAVLDWQMPIARNAKMQVRVRRGQAASTPAQSLVLRENTGSYTVINGDTVVRISKTAFSLFESYTVAGREMVEPGSDLLAETPEGKLFYASLCPSITSRIDRSGPEVIILEISGQQTAEDGATLLDFRLRYTFRAGDPCVQISHKMTNRQDPEMGIHLARIWMELPTTLGTRTTKYVRQMTHGLNWWPRPVELKENVELQSGSFTSAMTQSVYGNTQNGKIVIRDMASFKEKLAEYPHYLRPGNARTDMAGGLRAAYPHLGLTGNGASALAWFPQMELHYPKGIAATRNRLRFDIWPAWSQPLRLNRGMSREHDLRLTFQAGEKSFAQMEAIFQDHEVIGFGIFACGDAPVKVAMDPAYARSCKVLDLDRWLSYDEDRYLTVETKLGSAGQKGAVNGRGELDLGDGIIRDCSGNNENDSILDTFRQYFRLKEPGFLSSALISARHNAHVDFIASDPDPLRQGTMAAHCPNHSDGATYPSHMWVGGLLAAWCLTAERDFEAAAIAVGENMRRWQIQRPEIFYCDSRECGWPMLAYVQLWHHTHDQRWLDYAEEVFQAYRRMMTPQSEILHEIPHGMGTFLQGYGEFMTWRACYFYYEASGKEAVKQFLLTCLSQPPVYLRSPRQLGSGGWACNDLFPAWAAYTLSGEKHFLTDNYPFLRCLMSRDRFPWGGVDMHYYLNALHELKELDPFC